MPSTWKITLKKGCYTASYSGDLQEALEKAEVDLMKYLSDKNVERWARIFIRLAKEELKRREEENG